MRALRWSVLWWLAAACTKHDAIAPAPGSTLPAADAPAPSAVATGVPRAEDAIDRLAKRLAAEPMWENGMFPRIALPETSTIDELVPAAFGRVSFDHGRARRRTIVASRSVRVGEESYVAAIVDTDVGRKVLLARWRGPQVGWWTRVFADE